MTQPNIFQEIEADLERQRLEDLWRRFGPYLIAVAAAILLVTGSYTAWRAWHTQKMQAATSSYMTLAAADKKDDAATLADLEKFAQGNSMNTQGAMALFQAAAIAAQQGDKGKAQSYYASIASNGKLDDALRQLASLYSVQIQMDTGDARELLQKLEPLTGMDAAFRPSALELSGYLELKLGNRDKAREDFNWLITNSAVPAGISDRANAMLRYLAE